MQPTARNVRPTDFRADPAYVSARRLVWPVVAVLAAVGVYTAWCDTPMIWDGAYQFCFSLIERRPYFYLTRFHSYILWTPMVWLSYVTGNLTALKMAYGLPFTLAPAASVLMSWGVVRRTNPRLVLWAVFGAAAGPLPGQIFVINDSIFQQHMFWPVFLGMLVPLRWTQRVGLGALVVFQFSHQIGMVLLAGAAGAAVLLALRERAHRRELLVKAAVAAALAVFALWKIVHFPDSYAQREFTWARAKEAWLYGVAGWPLYGLALMWAAGACLLLARKRPDKFDARAAGLVAGVAIVIAAPLWSHWASRADLWSDALNYRRWVVPLTMPFYFMAFLDAFVGPSDAGAARRVVSFNIVGYAVAGTFALVLTIQTVVWTNLTRRLMRDVEAYPATIVPWSAVAWSRDTALYHWGTESYVFVREGRRPGKLVLDPDPENAATELRMLAGRPAKVPLSWFTPMPPVTPYFDFRTLVEGAKANEPPMNTDEHR